MRLKRVQITGGFIQEMITEGWEGSARCTKGLPPGAEFVRSYYDEMSGLVNLVFHHPDFEQFDEGESIPIIDIAMGTI